METIRSPIGNRTFSNWKPYVLDIKTVKGSYLQR